MQTKLKYEITRCNSVYGMGMLECSAVHEKHAEKTNMTCKNMHLRETYAQKFHQNSQKQKTKVTSQNSQASILSRRSESSVGGGGTTSWRAALGDKKA